MARFTIDVLDSVRDRLERVRVRSEAASITEVIRRSLAVYEVLLEAEASGGRVLLEASDKTIRHLLVR